VHLIYSTTTLFIQADEDDEDGEWEDDDGDDDMNGAESLPCLLSQITDGEFGGKNALFARPNSISRSKNHRDC
jgi:hypothetical protein